MLEKVKSGKTYRNKKTGDLYKVLCIARNSADTQQCLVVYHKTDADKERYSWVRSYNEFLEKFE